MPVVLLVRADPALVRVRPFPARAFGPLAEPADHRVSGAV
jgi:hypothetical protein